MKSFAVIGHDGRQEAAAEYLKKQGFTVYKAEGVHLADYILLPMPLSADNASLTQLLHAAKAGAVAFAGKICPDAQEIAQSANIELIDYLQREELAMLNAIPTVEGAIEILLANRRRTLWQSHIVITGFGRIARLLAHRLAAFGAYVIIAARSAKNRAEAEAMGYKAIDISALETLAETQDIIINTVPALIVTEQVLAKLHTGSFVLDLASVPGGIDFAAAKRLFIDNQWALSLPAKTAPITAGEFVAKTVLLMIAERGCKNGDTQN